MDDVFYYVGSYQASDDILLITEDHEIFYTVDVKASKFPGYVDLMRFPYEWKRERFKALRPARIEDFKYFGYAVPRGFAARA